MSVFSLFSWPFVLCVLSKRREREDQFMVAPQRACRLAIDSNRMPCDVISM